MHRLAPAEREKMVNASIIGSLDYQGRAKVRFIMADSNMPRYWNRRTDPRLMIPLWDACKVIGVRDGKEYTEALERKNPDFKQAVTNCQIRLKDGSIKRVKAVNRQGLRRFILQLSGHTDYSASDSFFIDLGIDAFRGEKVPFGPICDFDTWAAEQLEDTKQFRTAIERVANNHQRATSGPGLPADGEVGVYRISDQVSPHPLVYIGMSKNLKARLGEHLTGGNYAYGARYEYQRYPCEWGAQVAEMLEINRAVESGNGESLQNSALIGSEYFSLSRRHCASPQELVFGKIIDEGDLSSIRIDADRCHHDHSEEVCHPYALLEEREAAFSKYWLQYLSDCGAIPPIENLQPALIGLDYPQHDAAICPNPTCYSNIKEEYSRLDLFPRKGISVGYDGRDAGAELMGFHSRSLYTNKSRTR